MAFLWQPADPELQARCFREAARELDDCCLKTIGKLALGLEAARLEFR